MQKWISKRGVFLLMSALISCNQESSKSKSNQNNSITFIITDNKDIFGSWSLCSRSGKGTMIQMNTCPLIVFKNNGRGFVQNNSTITENFDWVLNKRNMRIIYANKSANLTFPDTNYYADFNKNKDRIDLMLRHNDQYFYLSK